ncbi:hypothetical protein EI94DRAFT_1707206 [Lactarius quietus]|nr:hypothetical protein EI94DRAFT_1707206 [Lactarius quietus]
MALSSGLQQLPLADEPHTHGAAEAHVGLDMQMDTLVEGTTPSLSAVNGSKPAKKYASTVKMIPGGAVTARNLCAKDWCKSHPNGTKGDFAMHWDTIDPASKALYKNKEIDMKAQAKGKTAI